MRIGSLWLKKSKDEGQKYIGGEIQSDSGINLPAGMKLQCKLVKNDRKTAGDTHPDYFLEAWFPRPKSQANTTAAGASSDADDIPF